MTRNQDEKLPLSTRVAYAPLGLLLAAIGRLPLAVTRPAADFIAFLAADVVKYRRRIVRRNIADSFPEKDVKEVRRIARGFYRWLADYFVETLRFPYMSEREISRRMTFRNTEAVDSLLDAGRPVMIYTAHYGNWEWITSMGLHTRRKDVTYSHVYRPLKNRWFDRLFLRIRSRFNESIPMKRVFMRMARGIRSGEPIVTGFLSDQKPDLGSKQFTVPFLGRPTPFIGGTEELARKLGAALLYFDVRPVRRGYYETTLVPIAGNAAALPEGEATRRYAELLERTIRRDPAQYLWSHNKWRLPKKKPK